MRFYISPFGYVSYRVVLAVGFTLAAIGILFFDVIIRMFFVCLIGFIGWSIGALIDDKALFHRWTNNVRNAFSGRGR
jgi:hypothetical protein